MSSTHPSEVHLPGSTGRCRAGATAKWSAHEGLDPRVRQDGAAPGSWRARAQARRRGRIAGPVGGWVTRTATDRDVSHAAGTRTRPGRPTARASVPGPSWQADDGASASTRTVLADRRRVRRHPDPSRQIDGASAGTRIRPGRPTTARSPAPGSAPPVSAALRLPPSACRLRPAARRGRCRTPRPDHAVRADRAVRVPAATGPITTTSRRRPHGRASTCHAATACAVNAPTRNQAKGKRR